MSDLTYSAAFIRSAWLVVGAGGGANRVGVILRPELAPKAAGKWLANCLNPERRERLAPAHVVGLMCVGRGVGCHAIAECLADHAGYERPAPVDVQAEVCRLMRMYVAGAQQLARLSDRIEHLKKL